MLKDCRSWHRRSFSGKGRGKGKRNLLSPVIARNREATKKQSAFEFE
jgi:hypothetical protein